MENNHQHARPPTPPLKENKHLLSPATIYSPPRSPSSFMTYFAPSSPQQNSIISRSSTRASSIYTLEYLFRPLPELPPEVERAPTPSPPPLPPKDQDYKSPNRTKHDGLWSSLVNGIKGAISPDSPRPSKTLPYLNSGEAFL